MPIPLLRYTGTRAAGTASWHGRAHDQPLCPKYWGPYGPGNRAATPFAPKPPKGNNMSKRSRAAVVIPTAFLVAASSAFMSAPAMAVQVADKGGTYAEVAADPDSTPTVVREAGELPVKFTEDNGAGVRQHVGSDALSLNDYWVRYVNATEATGDTDTTPGSNLSWVTCAGLGHSRACDLL